MQREHVVRLEQAQQRYEETLAEARLALHAMTEQRNAFGTPPAARRRPRGGTALTFASCSVCDASCGSIATTSAVCSQLLSQSAHTIASLRNERRLVRWRGIASGPVRPLVCIDHKRGNRW